MRKLLKNFNVQVKSIIVQSSVQYFRKFKCTKETTAFWDIEQCSLAEVDWHFRGQMIAAVHTSDM